MARSNDLVPLFAESGGPGVGMRQGVVVTFNNDTAENTVQVGNSLMTNLAILNSTEASLLAPGDVVTILTSGGTWGILGRFTQPGTPEAVSAIESITNRIQAAEDISSGTRNSTSWGDLTGVGVGPAVTIRVGSSGRVLAFWSAEIGQTTVVGTATLQSQTKNTPHVGVQVSGANTIAPEAWHALNVNLESASSSQFWIQATAMHLYTGLNPGNTTFTMKYRHDGLTPAADLNFNAREIAVFAL